MSKMSRHIIDQEEAGNIVFDDIKGEHYVRVKNPKDRDRNILSKFRSPREPTSKHDEDWGKFHVNPNRSKKAKRYSAGKVK